MKISRVSPSCPVTKRYEWFFLGNFEDKENTSYLKKKTLKHKKFISYQSYEYSNNDRDKHHSGIPDQSAMKRLCKFCFALLYL